MKNKLVNLYDKLMLRKRAIIETVNDQLKIISLDANTHGIVRYGILSEMWQPD